MKQTEYIVSMTKEWSTKIINSITLGKGLELECGQISHMMKCLISNKILELLSIDQIYQVYNDKQGKVYQNCKFHDPQGRDGCRIYW